MLDILSAEITQLWRLTMLERGVEFMIIGMAVVFLFLTLMVAIIMLVSYFFKKYSSFLPVEENAAVSTGDRKIAAIIAAVSSYARK